MVTHFRVIQKLLRKYNLKLAPAPPDSRPPFLLKIEYERWVSSLRQSPDRSLAFTVAVCDGKPARHTAR